MDKLLFGIMVGVTLGVYGLIIGDAVFCGPKCRETELTYEAARRGLMVQCIGKAGYYWGCD